MAREEEARASVFEFLNSLEIVDCYNIIGYTAIDLSNFTERLREEDMNRKTIEIIKKYATKILTAAETAEWFLDKEQEENHEL